MTPLQLLRETLFYEFDMDFRFISPEETSLCFAYTHPTNFPSVEPARLESLVQWKPDKGEVHFSTLIEDPLLKQRTGIMEFMSGLKELLRPSIRGLLPPTGLVYCLGYMDTVPKKKGLAAGAYLGNIELEKDTDLHAAFVAHMYCSSRMLYLARPVLRQVAKCDGWPRPDECSELIKKELLNFHQASSQLAR